MVQSTDVSALCGRSQRALAFKQLEWRRCTWQVGGLAQIGGSVARNPGDDGDEEDAADDGALEVAGHQDSHDCQPSNSEPKGSI